MQEALVKKPVCTKLLYFFIGGKIVTGFFFQGWCFNFSHTGRIKK